MPYPKDLPVTDNAAEFQYPAPNRITIPARQAGFHIDVAMPSWVRPTGLIFGKLYAQPGRPVSTTELQYSLSGSYALYLPAKGRWFIYYDYATAGLEAVVIADGLTPAASMFYMKDGYTVPAHTQLALNLGSAQTVIAGNVARTFLSIQNNGTGYARLRWDGTNPTTSTGFRLAPGDTVVFEGKELFRNAVAGIEESGSTTLDIVEGT